MFSVAPGVGAALSNMSDRRAYWLFYGDLDQMGQIYLWLAARGYDVVKSNVYPGFVKDNKDAFIRALKEMFLVRAYGWWSQREALIEHKICTEAEYRAALDKETR